MKHLFAASAVLGLALGLTVSAAGAADLKICVEGAYPPFSETTPSGELKGFDIDIANALCAEMGKSCDMVQTEWDGIIPALLERKCDAIIASMSITPDRQKIIDFSEKYYNSPGRFVAKADADWSFDKAGLADKVVGVQRGTIYHDFMNAEMPDTELKLYGTQDEAYLDLGVGRVDAIMADALAMDEGFLKTDAGKGFAFHGQDYSDPKYFGEGAGIGVRKGDSMKDNWSAAIKAIRASGEYDTLQKKYFAIDIYGG